MYSCASDFLTAEKTSRPTLMILNGANVSVGGRRARDFPRVTLILRPEGSITLLKDFSLPPPPRAVIIAEFRPTAAATHVPPMSSREVSLYECKIIIISRSLVFIPNA